jgi:hypothetical protein
MLLCGFGGAVVLCDVASSTQLLQQRRSKFQIWNGGPVSFPVARQALLTGENVTLIALVRPIITSAKPQLRSVVCLR